MEGRQGRGRNAEDNRYENANLSQAGSSRGRSHGYFEQAKSSNRRSGKARSPRRRLQLRQ